MVKLIDPVKKGLDRSIFGSTMPEWVSRYTNLSPEYIQTNQVSPMVLNRLVLPDMLAQGSGHILSGQYQTRHLLASTRSFRKLPLAAAR